MYTIKAKLLLPFARNEMFFPPFYSIDYVDFFTNTSDPAESNDFSPEEPHNENVENSTLSDQQGDNSSSETICLLPVFPFIWAVAK